MAATSTRKNNTGRMISLYRIVATVICIAALLTVPTHSFGSLPTAASLGRRNKSLSTLPNLLSFDNSERPSSTTVLFNSKKDNEGGEADDEGLFAEKNLPGLVFTTVLTLWHFWIGPALRPIILDMQQ